MGIFISYTGLKSILMDDNTSLFRLRYTISSSSIMHLPRSMRSSIHGHPLRLIIIIIIIATPRAVLLITLLLRRISLLPPLPILVRLFFILPPCLLPTLRPLLIPLLLLNLPLHQPNPLILPPPTRLVHMELAAPSSRRRTLHVGDDLRRRRQGRGRLLRAGSREFYLFGGIAEEGGDLGGLFGLRADGTALYGALAAFICACGDGLGAGFGHLVVFSRFC